jgi:hypothetical protein
LKRGAEWITNDDILPAQKRHRHVERFSEIETRKISREKNLRPDDRVEVRLRDMTDYSRDPLADQVAYEGLTA